MKTGKFIVVAGIDGSGKTTLIQELLLKQPELKTTNWKCFESLIDKKFDPPGISTAEYIENLSPFTRSSLFLHNFGLQLDKIILPSINTGFTVISDSYWYKFTAKMHVTKHGNKYLLDACSSLPKPDKVLFLDTPAEIAFTRKTTFNYYESFGNKNNFVNYQKEVRKTILSFISEIKDVLVLGEDMDLDGKVASALHFMHS